MQVVAGKRYNELKLLEFVPESKLTLPDWHQKICVASKGA